MDIVLVLYVFLSLMFIIKSKDVIHYYLNLTNKNNHKNTIQNILDNLIKHVILNIPFEDMIQPNKINQTRKVDSRTMMIIGQTHKILTI